MGNANDRQVAGGHYGAGKKEFQHWDIVVEHELDYFQAQITRYIMRCKKKNGLEDVEKAQHYIEKYLELIKAGKVPGVFVPLKKAPLPPAPGNILKAEDGDATKEYVNQ